VTARLRGQHQGQRQVENLSWLLTDKGLKLNLAQGAMADFFAEL
jgi:hypothetical protein